MNRTFSNIVLIGMPGSGKSTVGPLLAAQTGRRFVDTDALIEERHARPLQDIVDSHGHTGLLDIESAVLLDLDVENHVVSTGGSAVYGEQAMAHLRTKGFIVFLDVSLATLEARIPDFSTRGLAKRPEQSFADLFAERNRLYHHYADITIECDPLTPAEVCARIVAALPAAR